MKAIRYGTVLVTAGIVFCTMSLSQALDVDKPVQQAMKKLKAEKADRGLLVLTNATYVRMSGQCPLPVLERVQDLTGCTVGRGNLLFFQRPQHHALRIMLFKKDTADAVILSLDQNRIISESVCMDMKHISREEFWEKAGKLSCGKDIFTLVTLANAWVRGAPYDFLKCAELHNHLCPGVTSGYLIARYILKKFPLKNGEKYVMISSPVWCKEEAFPVVLGCSPGRRDMVVKPLSSEQVKNVSVKRPAGMVLIWNSTKKTGKGIALQFDFATLLDGRKGADMSRMQKAIAAIKLVRSLNSPEKYVKSAAEFEVTEAVYNQLLNAGTNPYQAAGLLKKP